MFCMRKNDDDDEEEEDDSPPRILIQVYSKTHLWRVFSEQLLSLS